MEIYHGICKEIIYNSSLMVVISNLIITNFNSLFTSLASWLIFLLLIFYILGWKGRFSFLLLIFYILRWEGSNIQRICSNLRYLHIWHLANTILQIALSVFFAHMASIAYNNFLHMGVIVNRGLGMAQWLLLQSIKVLPYSKSQTYVT